MDGETNSRERGKERENGGKCNENGGMMGKGGERWIEMLGIKINCRRK